MIYISDNDFLLKQWDFERNTLDPNTVKLNYRKNVHWICPVSSEHAWSATPRNRFEAGNGCPFCVNRKVDSKNNLEFMNPVVAREFMECRNGTAPRNIVGSGLFPYWWKCGVCDHEWKSSCRQRVVLGQGCPACVGKHVTHLNNLAVRYPEIVAILHPYFNFDFDPYKITPGLPTRAWWVCDYCDHIYDARVNNRVNGCGCPACHSMAFNKFNNLLINFPNISAELDISKNYGFGPETILPHSHNVYSWVCGSCGLDWEDEVCARTRNGDVPGCSGCINESRGEYLVKSALSKLQFHYMPQYKFLGSEISTLRFDFMVNVLGKKCLIEFQGKQHYEPVSKFGGLASFEKIQKNDSRKRNFCYKNGHPLLEVCYKQINKTEKIVLDFVETQLFTP